MKELIAKVLYLPAMILILFLMLMVICIACIVFYYSSGLSGVLEPDWFKTIIVVSLHHVADLMRSENDSAWQVLISVFIFISGLVMGVFLIKCASKENRFEVFLTVVFLVFAISQLLLIALLPDVETAKEHISNPKPIIENMILVLKAGANLCLVVFGAAVGVKFS